VAVWQGCGLVNGEGQMLALRAVMSLARLWQQQGKRAEAHEMLADIYSWFTGSLRRRTCKRPRGCWKS
jgi:hypothetical protein